MLTHIPGVERVQAILFGMVEEEQGRPAGEDGQPTDPLPAPR